MDKTFARYLVVMLLVAGVVFAGRQGWEETVKVGCLPAGGVAPTAGWLADCASDRIGNYDHSAIWFETEPSVRKAITSAKALIFGDSRMLGAMSQGDVPEWFEKQQVPFYLLAFTFGEQSGWAKRLLAKFHPHPAVMVFDTDPFFTGGQSLPAQAIESDPAGELKAILDIKSFIAESADYCRYLGFFCGRTASFYRSYRDGHLFTYQPERFWFGRRPVAAYPITPPPADDTSHYEEYLHNAQALLQEVDIPPQCVVFTTVPNSEKDGSLARFLAEKLGATAIIPSPAGMQTIDHMHLTTASAIKWTSLFVEDLLPVLKSCSATTPSHRDAETPDEQPRLRAEATGYKSSQ